MDSVRASDQDGERRYSENHLWFDRAEGTVTVGLTEQITRILTWVNSIELPAQESVLEAGDELATIDSQKTVLTVTTPVRLQVQSLNDELVRDPMLIRIDPLGRGWLARASLTDAAWETLMPAEAYERSVQGGG